MEIRSISVDSNAITATSMGQPYAFVGGLIDLEPHRAQVHVIGHSLDLVIFTDEGEYRLFEEFSALGDSGIDTILKTVQVREDLEIFPAGITQALREWLIEQGVEVTDGT